MADLCRLFFCNCWKFLYNCNRKNITKMPNLCLIAIAFRGADKYVLSICNWIPLWSMKVCSWLYKERGNGWCGSLLLQHNVDLGPIVNGVSSVLKLIVFIAKLSHFKPCLRTADTWLSTTLKDVVEADEEEVRRNEGIEPQQAADKQLS